MEKKKRGEPCSAEEEKMFQWGMIVGKADAILGQITTMQREGQGQGERQR